MEDDKIKRRSSLSLIFLSSACTQRRELPKTFAELADTTTHAHSFGHPLIWTAAAPRHPRPLRPFLRLPLTMQLSSKTSHQTASANSSRCRRVPVGTSDEGRQRVGFSPASVFGLPEPLRSPGRKAECRPVRWDEAQPLRCLICGHPGTTCPT